MQISEIFDSATGFVALGALVAIALLLPLYLSQRRDVQRMRAWMDREPGHPAADIAASEAILDHAEGELEAGPEAAAAEPAPEPGTTPSAPVPAATRVTHERPALERITMERAALATAPLAPLRRRPSPVCSSRSASALLLGGAAIYASEELLRDGGEGEGPRAGDRPGRRHGSRPQRHLGQRLAGNVGSDIEASGYVLGPVSSTTPGVEKTAVLYADGKKRAAQKVARDLGVDKATVEPVDRETRLAGDADVVVIAGEDRTS